MFLSCVYIVHRYAAQDDLRAMTWSARQKKCIVLSILLHFDVCACNVKCSLMQTVCWGQLQKQTVSDLTAILLIRIFMSKLALFLYSYLQFLEPIYLCLPLFHHGATSRSLCAQVLDKA